MDPQGLTEDKAPLDNRDQAAAQERKEFARNTAPLMEESSSKMEPDANSLLFILIPLSSTHRSDLCNCQIFSTHDNKYIVATVY